MLYHRDALVAELRARGISYLAPGDTRAMETIISDQDLIAALLDQPDARLQLARVALLIRHPDLADHIPALVRKISSLIFEKSLPPEFHTNRIPVAAGSGHSEAGSRCRLAGRVVKRPRES
jgi:hypothetical protein